jgi:hypothetical protein
MSPVFRWRRATLGSTRRSAGAGAVFASSLGIPVLPPATPPRVFDTPGSVTPCDANSPLVYE